jgi:hypothetical protein
LHLQDTQMDPTKLSAGDGGFSITIDDLIKANYLQRMMADATIKILEEAKANQAELELYRKRETRRLKLQNPELGENNDHDV